MNDIKINLLELSKKAAMEASVTVTGENSLCIEWQNNYPLGKAKFCYYTVHALDKQCDLVLTTNSLSFNNIKDLLKFNDTLLKITF